MRKLASIALMALCSATLAASPELEEMDRKTADALRLAEASHPVALDAMNKNYLLALQKLEAERKQEGDLRQLLMVRDDIKAFTESLEIGRGNHFPRLKVLRDAYQKEFHRLQAAHLQKKAALLETHRTNLLNLQKKLTRNDLIAEALEVEKALLAFDPRLEKAREEVRSWSEVKPENSIAHLNRKNRGANEKGKPKGESEKTEPGPAPSPTTTNPFADPQEEPAAPAKPDEPAKAEEPAQPAEPVKPAEPDCPFSPPPPAPL